VSISLTFYAQLFCMKVKLGAYLYLQFRLKCFWHKEIRRKASRKNVGEIDYRSKKEKAKVLLISRMRENIPHSNSTQDSEFLNRLQFVQTALSQDGKTLCFCGKETGTKYWIFRLKGNG
jgi:hypothetical protein